MTAPTTKQLEELVSRSTAPHFPSALVGKKVLLATESLGPVNGVSRTTQSLVDYLRKNGVFVATCAPYYNAQPVNNTELLPVPRRIVNQEWLCSIEAKLSALGSRAIGGAWQWHSDRDVSNKQQSQLIPRQSGHQTRKTPMLTRNRSNETNKNPEIRRSTQEIDFRLQGYPLPYNPDLTVAYPFRLGVVYQNTFKPDVIYLASPASVGFQFLVQLGQLDKPAPTILNFQTDLSAYSGILFAPPLDRYAVFLLQMVQGYLFRMLAVRTIFYPSAYVRKYMENAGAPSHKMVQLGRGVDTELFHPSRREEAYKNQISTNNEIIFCCISRLAPEKGFAFLAQVTQKLKDSGLKFKLVIVGGNKNPTVEGQVRSYFKSLSDEVIFTGFLYGNALARAYASADVFLHCSITETFGLVVLESMASGVPIVARDEGGPSETVKHGRSGYLVNPHDPDTFAQYAYRLATDHRLRRDMAIDAREQALDTTWDKINHRVAVELAASLKERIPRTEGHETPCGFYGDWSNILRVYFAVTIIWLFWIIACVPLLICGFLHGLLK